MESQKTANVTLNAGSQSPVDVAETFVVNSQFYDLFDNNHALLMGPRGSGKTTLLKMLTLPALASWDDSEGEILRDYMPFTAIYVPADIHWHRQLSHLQDLLSASPYFSELASSAAVTTNLLIAVCETFMDRLVHEFAAQRSPQAEALLCRELCTAWRIPDAVTELPAVNIMLKTRLKDISAEIRDMQKTGCPDERVGVLPEYFFMDGISAAANGCTAFDTVFPNPRKNRWALCLDEFDSAPAWLQRRVLADVQSSAQAFLFKIATGPVPRLDTGDFDGLDRDFQVLRLWPQYSIDARRFCDRLTRSILERRQCSPADPDALFGLSPIAGEVHEDSPEAYLDTVAAYQAISDLAQEDGGLRSILERHGISDSNLCTNVLDSRGAVIKKIMPAAILRRELSGVKKLSDRTAQIGPYWGTDTIYRVSEGNPRRLIRIVNALIDAADRDEDGFCRQVCRDVQARVLTEISREFSESSTVHPHMSAEWNGEGLHFHKVLESAGSYFFDRVVHDEFSLNPVGSFTVDDGVPDGLMECLREAAFHGSVVCLSNGRQALNPKLRGMRFRLSFTLSPAWKLPLELYGPVKFGLCLRTMKEPRRSRKSRPAAVDQRSAVEYEQ